ncbi:MAG: CoA transferase [Thermaerobacter sp.]|nr:CoA transferase [Thermaerobacter sp.]
MSDLKGPLRGIHVLDLSRVLAGPYATMALGELGARVIKVEHVLEGDETRSWGPPFAAGESAYYLGVNRNKESIALDLTRPQAQEIVRRLAIDWADVVVENFRPGNLDRFNLPLSALRDAQPRLITASVRGYPLGDDRAGYDFVIQGAGGLMSVTGPEEGDSYKVGVAAADLFTSSFLLSGVLAALYERTRTGFGQHLSVSLFESQVAMLANVASSYLLTGNRPRRYGNAHPSMAPYEDLRTKDGRITVGVGNDRQFLSLARSLHHEEWIQDPRFRTNPDRVAHRSELKEAIEAALADKTQQEALSELTQSGIPCGPIRSVDEVFAGPEVAQAGTVVHMRHPLIEDLPQVRLPWRYSRTPAEPHLPPPLHGQHTRRILRELGMSEDEIRQALATGYASAAPVGQDDEA